MTQWTEQKLQALPSHKGFRLRGLEMTRLEAFTDAAFAFALTMLIISQSGIPHNVADLLNALEDIPAYLASFATIASFWNAHRKWSRRYGLDDRAAILISLGLIFVMLIFVYPLKMVFSALFAWISAGWLPTSFVLQDIHDMTRLFVIYGLGFWALTSIIGLLYVQALREADDLELNSLEQLKTRKEIVIHFVLSMTGLLSSLWAGLLPLKWGIWAGFSYVTLWISMPLVSKIYAKKEKRLKSV